MKVPFLVSILGVSLKTFYEITLHIEFAHVTKPFILAGRIFETNEQNLRLKVNKQEFYWPIYYFCAGMYVDDSFKQVLEDGQTGTQRQ